MSRQLVNPQLLYVSVAILGVKAKGTPTTFDGEEDSGSDDGEGEGEEEEGDSDSEESGTAARILTTASFSQCNPHTPVAQQSLP